ncbi:hypothetical protein LCGC14_1850100 [marine sediment metagenome]|uniref:Portal protein n=1 Tax=marine sediment metagenome TaxID=412755 RepID=A0A0F9IQ66_9ZZZZ
MPREVDERPTIEKIVELAGWTDRHWARQRTIDHELKLLANDEHQVVVPDTNDPNRRSRIEPERMSTAEGVRSVDAISALYTLPAPVSFMWTGSGTKTERQRDEMFNAVQEITDQLNPATDSPRDRERIQTVALGRKASLFLPGNAYWWDAPVGLMDDESEKEGESRRKIWRRKAPVPILWRDLPAERTFPASLSRIDDEAISWLPSTWWELLDIFGTESQELNALMPEKEDLYKQVTLIIYANRKYIAWAVTDSRESDDFGIGSISFHGQPPSDGQIIRIDEHGLDRCPIRIISGKTGGWKEPGIYWRSILYGARDLIASADRRLSEAATSSKFSVLPTILAWLREQDDEDAQERIERALMGDIVMLDPGGDGENKEDMKPLHVPAPGSTSMDLAQVAIDMIRRLTGATESLEGGIGPASQPAWSKNFGVQIALSNLAPLTRSIVAQDIDSAEMILRCAHAFGEDIVLQRHSADDQGQIVLKPKDLLDWEPLIISEYKPKIPTDTRADLALAVDVLERIGNPNSSIPLSPPYIMENYLDIKKPFEELQRAETWRFLQSPEMKQWRMKKLLEEADVELQGDEGVSQQEFQQQFAGQIPPQMEQMVQQRMGGSSNGQVRSINQTTRQQGIPFARGPGGAQPSLEA